MRHAIQWPGCGVPPILLSPPADRDNSCRERGDDDDESARDEADDKQTEGASEAVGSVKAIPW